MANFESSPADDPIVITGYGCVTPLGLTAESSWEELVAGKSGISALPDDLSGYSYNVHAVARVKGFEEAKLTELTGLRVQNFRRIHRSGLFALHAVAEALNRADLNEKDTIQLKSTVDSARVGTAIGSGAAGAELFSTVRQHLNDNKAFKPPTTLKALPERIASVPARLMEARGPIVSVVAACATGNANIISGIEKILLGHADVMIAGSSEAQTTPEALAMFDVLGALDNGIDFKNTSKPFHTDQKGFVMGEGAGIVVLERLSHAQKRGVERVYGTIAGYGETCDASESDTLLNGIGSEIALRAALRTSGYYESAYINAHATGTIGDGIEMDMINRTMDRERTAGISSTKGATGHGVGAAGSIEAVFSVLALNSGIIPPTLKLDSPLAQTIGWEMSPFKATKVEQIDLVINNSFGFGGINVVLAIQKYR